MTCVKGKSEFLITAKMKDDTSVRLSAVKERTSRIIPPKLRQTLTVDNGKEFSGHEQLSERLQLPFYFAHACSSNERATNKNTNGLRRQFFPKKTDFRNISHHALAHVTNQLDNRPRKRLNYLTPLEVLTQAGFALLDGNSGQESKVRFFSPNGSVLKSLTLAKRTPFSGLLYQPMAINLRDVQAVHVDQE